MNNMKEEVEKENHEEEQMISKKNVESTNKTTNNPIFIPPDGGYGWIVALAACLIRIFSIGFLRSYGFLHVHISAANPDATAYEVSWIPSMLGLIGQFICKLHEFF